MPPVFFTFEFRHRMRYTCSKFCCLRLVQDGACWSLAKVRIRIEAEHGKQGGRIVAEATGERFVKGDACYIRYKEPDPEMGDTTVTLRIDAQELRIVRHGDVRSEQRFARGVVTAGYMETAHGKLPLEMRTRRLINRTNAGIGTMEWRYELYVGGDYAGMYTLKASLREESE